MAHHFSLFVLLAIFLVALIGCAPPSPAGVATPVSTAEPARDARTPLPLPPQPTSPPQTVRAATPFVSPTFSSIVGGVPVVAGTPPTAAPTALPVVATATATRPAATATQAAAGPTAAGGRAEIKLVFVVPLGTVELVDDLRDKLLQVSGIISVSGNENEVTVGYNPALITIEQIRQRMASIGNAVKP